ncbi:transcription repressor OFP14 [Phoenix dactylifera]|uniref:Transcription repressor n=1 Tax=Phoenix dactylifera TaxID=42345 RepID=A0A8B7BFK4_PHODC|nr:transcription repressor OFP14 [Phoenix dactylifera]
MKRNPSHKEKEFKATGHVSTVQFHCMTSISGCEYGEDHMVLKKVPTLRLPNPPSPSNAAGSWLLSACKYPKTPSFAIDRDQPDDDGSGGARDPAATLSDVDRFLYENFGSLYYRDKDGTEFSSESPSYDAELTAGMIRSSERFFVSPGTSNSLLDEARPSAAASSSSSRRSDAGPAVLGDGVAVTTFTKDPYDDFRRSMQDMVEARHVDPRQPLDWDFMEELLFCYLELNDRSVHKYILRAFTDLAVSYRRRGRRRRKTKEGQVAVVPRNFPVGVTGRS